MRFPKEPRATTALKAGKSSRAAVASDHAAALPDSNRGRIEALWSLSIGNSVGRSGPSIGATDTAFEREADRWSKHMSSPQGGAHSGSGVSPLASLRPSPWSDALHSQWGSGAPLESGIRTQLEQRAGTDLGQVRVHRNDAARDASARLGAQAWTVGTDVFLGAGAPSHDTPAGQRLLAHEMAHVLQQSHVGSLAPGLSSAPYQVQRQPMPPVVAPAAPAFSVNQATYMGLINSALGQMSARLVQTETLATTVEPILRAMVANAVWKDAAGATHGGGATTQTVGTTTLNLTLILSDDPNPLSPAGLFHHGASATDAQIEVFIQKNATADDLAQTLYHEAMHLVSWLINRPTPVLNLRARGTAGPSGAAATLDLARSTTQIASVRLWLDTLAQSVNPRRGTGAQISAAELDRMASWLAEEINVRVETEVFRQAEETQRLMNTRGPIVYITPGANWQINTNMIDRYVFDFSRVFLPTDRAGLTATDQQTLATLLQILEGIFQSRVSRRFNRTPYLMGRGLPRTPLRWIPPPLTPPTFRPLPLP